jgi:hypothetical protein
MCHTFVSELNNIVVQHSVALIRIISSIYWSISTQADCTLIDTSHKDKEEGTIEASITLDGVTLTDQQIR